MKFYKTSIQTGTDSYITVWDVSASGASKLRTALKDKAGINPNTDKPEKAVTVEHDIPTDKKGLLDWLNKNAL